MGNAMGSFAQVLWPWQGEAVVTAWHWWPPGAPAHTQSWLWGWPSPVAVFHPQHPSLSIACSSGMEK